MADSMYKSRPDVDPRFYDNLTPQQAWEGTAPPLSSTADPIEDTDPSRTDYLDPTTPPTSLPIDTASYDSVAVPTMTPVGQTTTTTTQIPRVGEAVALQGYADAAAIKDQALQDQMATLGAAGEEEQQALQRKIDAEVVAEDARQKNAQRYEELYQKEKATHDQLVEELANYEPKSFWADKGTGDKIAIAFSLIAGGLAQGLSGGQVNAAERALESAIARDIQLQEKRYNRKLAYMQEKKLSLKEIRAEEERMGSEILARKEAIHRQVDLVLDGLGKKTSNAKTKAEIETMRAENAGELAKVRLDTERSLRTTLVAKEELQAKKQAGDISALPADKQGAVKEISSKNAQIVGIRNLISSGLGQLQNPQLSAEDKKRIGQGLVKALNSDQGADAIGAEEARRLASELEGNVADIVAKAAAGATGGAALGATVGGVVGGIGAVPGAIGGSALGTIGGTISGVYTAMNDPGGIRLRPDIDGFTRRVELIRDKLDLTIDRNDRVSAYMVRGLSPTEAMAKADADITARLQKQSAKAPKK